MGQNYIHRFGTDN